MHLLRPVSLQRRDKFAKTYVPDDVSDLPGPAEEHDLPVRARHVSDVRGPHHRVSHLSQAGREAHLAVLNIEAAIDDNTLQTEAAASFRLHYYKADFLYNGLVKHAMLFIRENLYDKQVQYLCFLIYCRLLVYNLASSLKTQNPRMHAML